MPAQNRHDVVTVMPCFNTCRTFIREAVASVETARDGLKTLDATMSLLIVDDGSDLVETREALKEICEQQCWCEIISLPSHRGVAAARNVGIAHADAPWIAFLDTDDYWQTDGLLALARVAFDCSGEWISGDLRLQVEGDPPDTENFYLRHPRRYRHIQTAYETGKPIMLKQPVEAFLLDGSLCSMGSCLIRRELLIAAGQFCELLTKGVDTELYWRLARDADLIFCPWPIFVYRRHDRNLTNGGPLTSWQPTILQAMLSDPAWSPWRNAIETRLRYVLRELTWEYRRAHQRREALGACATALKHWPEDRFFWRQIVAALLGV